MNFNVYVNKENGKRVTQIAKALHRSRNSIINEALEEWLKQHTKTKWPKTFFDFPPIEDVSDFESLRKDLKNNVSEDPLA
jgi:hypothetical protein